MQLTPTQCGLFQSLANLFWQSSKADQVTLCRQRGIFKNPDLHSPYFPWYHKAIAYKAHTLSPKHVLFHTCDNSYSAWLKEAMHINEAQAKKPQLGWGHWCYNSPFPFQSVTIYYLQPPRSPPPHSLCCSACSTSSQHYWYKHKHSL